ncbi:multi-sensor signal transduction histidine kinase (plasmid) [Scytonema sp. HK-05]|uniref:PAS domain S-box protein n=1 Tax=Scytonema sp. HK-05 TaxID=1137095 RepID=UPI000935DD7B|nr:PAS domain S-box protein [Scytonema sp. HK-05]OKH56569.1 hypothetical protein NIES2130_24790 [Scytonema sp. HK-05]BAY50215.1 multi-sensor signal transduction histidine kinase [Scytonema sp. HK-05]
MAVKLLQNAITKLSSRLSLRTVLIVPLMLQIFGTVGLVGYLSFKSGQQAVDDVAVQLRQEISNRVQHYMQDYLEAPHLINKINANAIRLGILDVSNVKDTKFLERYFTQQIQVFNSVSYICVANEQGGMIGASRQNNRTLNVYSTENFARGNFAIYTADNSGNRKQLLSLTQNYDTRTRPWYITPVQAGKPTWSEIYTYVGEDNMGISAGLPFYDSTGKLKGVLATDLVISQISTFLQRIRVGESGTIFVVERSGLLVASSASEKRFFLNQNHQKARRVKATESTVPLVQNTAKYLVERFGNFNNISGSQQIDFTIERQRHFLQLTSLKDGRGIDWLIVVVVPEADFLKQIHANTRTTIFLCIIALIVAISICILTVRWITDPILRLNQSAKVLARGEWNQTVNIERSDELGELAKSFNSMTCQVQTSFNEMKALNEALSRSEKRFQMIAQVTNDAIWDWDLLTDYAWWNAGIQTIFGYTVNEIHPYTNWWYERIHPEDRERVILGTPHVLDANNAEQFWSAEYRFRRADGSYTYVADRGFVIRDDHGKPIRMIGGMTDITQRKQAQELLADYNRTLKQQVAEQTVELAREKKFLQVIIDRIPVMITLYEANGRIQFVNRELEQCLGWSSVELEKIDLLAECCPDLEQRQQVLEHMLGATEKWLDIKIRTKDGRYIDTSWANIRLSNGINIGIGQDISNRKRAEETSILEERNRMAREIHDTLAQAFTGILLHVGAATQVLIDDLEATQAHLEMINELAQTGLAEARRSVAALRPQLLEDGSLHNALHRLVTQMRAATDTAMIYEIKGTAYPLPNEVENNLLRIAQEALTNAIKYADACEIRVEIVYENTQCILRVKDDGLGFGVGSIPRVGGFGLLGMSERAENIGAQLTIGSQPGQGTEIVVIINRD